MESTESVPGPSGVQSQACPAGRDTCVDRHGCAPVKLYEHRNSNFRELLRFACHEIAYLNFFRPLKNVKKNPKNPSLACRLYKKQQVFRAGLQTTVCVPSPRPRPSMATVPIIRTVPLEPSHHHSWNHHSEVRTANPTTPVLPGPCCLSGAFTMRCGARHLPPCCSRHTFRPLRLRAPRPSRPQLFAGSINTFLTSCSFNVRLG